MRRGPSSLGRWAVLAASGALLAACALEPAGGSPKRGLSLSVRSINLPPDSRRFDGAGGEVLNARCLACHSASMVLTQPRMTPAQWRASVIKMRDVYRAPMPDSEIERVVAALTAQEVE